jgi:hypothetical protein
MKDIKKDYNKIKEKYNLPKLEMLEKEFNIELKNPDIILQNVVDGIVDTVGDTAKMLESLIFVDSGSPASHLYEASMLNDHKIDVFEMLKKMMSLYWAGKKVKIKADEKQMASFINTASKEWEKQKQEIIKMCETFEKEWHNVKLRETEEFGTYHG